MLDNKGDTILRDNFRVNNAGGTPLLQTVAATSAIGAYGVTPVVRPSAYTQNYSVATRVLNGYTADPESSPYTGLATGVLGTPYASVDDVNALRAAVENLRAFVENAVQVLNSSIDDDQAQGWKA